MALKCMVGMHAWSGCKCSQCGSTRDEGHDWTADCEKCARCDKTRSGAHAWSGCKCSRCGATVNSVIAAERLHSAAQARDMSALGELISTGADVDAKDKDGLTIFIKAAIDGDTETIAWLLDHGVDCRGGVDGTTALHLAANRGHGDTVSVLLARGADKNAHEGSEQWTPLILAAAMGYVQVVALLIAAGAETSARDSSGMAAIHYAARQGETEVVKALVEAGVDPNMMGEEQSLARPLHYATRTGQAAVVHCLVQKGARTDIKDSDGNTPLMIAQAREDNNVINALTGNYSPPVTAGPLHKYVPTYESAALTRKAIAELQSGNSLAAIATFTKAVESDRNNANAWGLLGSLLAQRREQSAADCFKEFVRIRPESPDGYRELVFAYSQAQRTGPALEAARTFTQVHPDNADAWAVLAALCVETAEQENQNGGIDKGIECYEKALRIDPNHELARKSLPSLYATKKAQGSA
jgi:ankyrin repeat protein